MIFTKNFILNKSKKLAYHRSYYRILGKHQVADVRHKSFESTPGNINTWPYYAENFSFEPGGQSQSEFFDKNSTLSMKGCWLHCFIKTVNVRNFMTMVVGMFTNIMKRYGSFIYIYLIQSHTILLQLRSYLYNIA